MPFSYPGLTPEKAAERRQDLLETFRRIIGLAKEEEVDALLICGDLYEHDYVRRSTIAYINDAFKEIPHIKVFIVPGNHDPLVPNSFYANFQWSVNVSILSREKPCVLLEELNTCIYGVGFKSFYEDGTPAYELNGVDTRYINILMTHGTVDMNVGRSVYNPMDSGKLSELGMDYIALGHFHNRLEDMSGRGLVFNPGSPEALGFDEPGEHGVFIAAIEKDGRQGKKTDMRFVKTGARCYEKLEVDVKGCSSFGEIMERLAAGIPLENSRHRLVSVKLSGYMQQDVLLDMPRLLEMLNEKFFYARIKDETLPGYDLEKLALEHGIRGLFVRKILAGIEKSEDEHEKKLLADALFYGLEALDRGTVNLREGVAYADRKT